MSYFVCDQCDKKHYIFGASAGTLKERFGIDTLAEIPILAQMILKIDKPIANDYIMQMVDKVIMSLGKNSILQKEIPDIKFDNQVTTLKWKEGTEITVDNRDLRLSCRCALCVNEITGDILLQEKDIQSDIAPLEITPLGNYAIAINWNDGHSSGIYPYDGIRLLSSASRK